MPKLPVVKPREVIRAIQKVGFVERRSNGSHKLFFHPLSNFRVTIACHNKTIKPKTLSSILKQANLSIKEFQDLL